MVETLSIKIPDVGAWTWRKRVFFMLDLEFLEVKRVHAMDHH